MKNSIQDESDSRSANAISSRAMAADVTSEAKSESKSKSLLPAFFNALLLAIVGTFLTSIFKNIETRQRAYDEYRKSAVRLHDDLTTAASARLFAARNSVIQMKRSGYGNVVKEADKKLVESNGSSASVPIGNRTGGEIFNQMRPAIDASMRDVSTQMMDWNRMVVARSQAIRRVFGMSINDGDFKILNDRLHQIGTDLERQYQDVILGDHPGEKPLCKLTDEITDEGFGAVFKVSGEMLKYIESGEVKRRWEEGEGRNYPVIGWE